METYSCIKIPFNEFQTIMDEICGMEDSYEYYWDISSSGLFFRKNDPDFTFIDLARYFDVSLIREILYVEPSTQGFIYIICE